ncbi:MAG: 4a-hydroxytetrahydrobiopterin dehydratase [Roseibacillus sp.]|nr:4a-hydroxytetrahydrobiopterin dehydratase [Roseibacillus sp.]
MDTTDDLPAADLADRLARCPAWELDGKEIGRPFEFESFPEAIDFVNEVAGIAEDAGHHPDIDIRYLRVSLRLTTHSRGALTGKDFELARRIDNFVD